MPTIKDVARLAGVSHGTVSNVLRGAKNVKLENVLKVKEAMKQLGYQPDQSAQALKSGATRNVSIILPGMLDPLCTSLFTAASDALTAMNYTVSLYVTNGIAAREREIIRKEISLKSAGLIVLTCQPQNTEFFRTVMSSETKFVFLERMVKDLPCNMVFCENTTSIYQAVCSLFDRGYRKIALITGPFSYTSEKLCEEGYRRALDEKLLPYRNDLVFETNFSSMSAFNCMMQLLKAEPDAIICSSSLLLGGIQEAITLGSSGNTPRLAALSEENWADHRFPDVDIIRRNSLDLGIQAARLLNESIENGSFSEARHISIPNRRIRLASSRSVQTVKEHRRPIRVAAIEGETSDALRALAPDLLRREGLRTQIDAFPQEKLYDVIRMEAGRDRYDVFAVDVVWLKEFAAHGYLRNLSGELSAADLKELNLQEELLEDFAYWNGKIYGVPLMYCSQLLFYRSDLFENSTYQRMFYEQYRQDLRVPQNWTEFNAVARFFTRKYNPESPVPYGTTLGGQYSCAAFCEFLPRLWAGGGEVFDHRGNAALTSFEAGQALQNYCESFRYASEGSSEHWWDEQVTEFISGKAAMMMMFSSYLSRIEDPQKSSVIGKYGFTEIPGRVPVLGGWSFAVNSRSENFRDALSFIKWACGKELSIPNTVLGNLSASKRVFESTEIYMIYPWVRKSLEIFPSCRRRELPAGKEGTGIQRLEQTVAKAVHDTILGRSKAEAALKEAAAVLESF